MEDFSLPEKIKFHCVGCNALIAMTSTGKKVRVTCPRCKARMNVNTDGTVESAEKASPKEPGRDAAGGMDSQLPQTLRHRSPGRGSRLEEKTKKSSTAGESKALIVIAAIFLVLPAIFVLLVPLLGIEDTIDSHLASPAEILRGGIQALMGADDAEPLKVDTETIPEEEAFVQDDDETASEEEIPGEEASIADEVAPEKEMLRQETPIQDKEDVALNEEENELKEDEAAPDEDRELGSPEDQP